ncbi:MAG: hypothetical protein ACUVRM_11230 [Bacillota bacterium]
MRRRLTGALILWAVLTAAVLAPVAAKGGGPKGGELKIEIKIKMAKEFANFPLPFAAELVAREKQKAPKGWTEYRVIGFSADTLAVFYRHNMPGHGWKLGHYKDNTWVWRRGHRTITVVFVEIGPFCLIQVRETRG